MIIKFFKCPHCNFEYPSLNNIVTGACMCGALWQIAPDNKNKTRVYWYKALREVTDIYEVDSDLK